PHPRRQGASDFEEYALRESTEARTRPDPPRGQAARPIGQERAPLGAASPARSCPFMPSGPWNLQEKASPPEAGKVTSTCTLILRGALPTAIVAVTVRFAKSTTETSLEPSLVT